MLSLISLILLVPAALASPSFVQIRDSPIITIPFASRMRRAGTHKLIEASTRHDFQTKPGKLTSLDPSMIVRVRNSSSNGPHK